MMTSLVNNFMELVNPTSNLCSLKQNNVGGAVEITYDKGKPVMGHIEIGEAHIWLTGIEAQSMLSNKRGGTVAMAQNYMSLGSATVLYYTEDKCLVLGVMYADGTVYMQELDDSFSACLEACIIKVIEVNTEEKPYSGSVRVESWTNGWKEGRWLNVIRRRQGRETVKTRIAAK